MNKCIAIASILIFGVVLGACSSVQGGAAHRLKIGYSVFNLTDGHFITMERGIREKVKAAGYDYVMGNQNSDEKTMIAVTQSLLIQNINALIISPFFPNDLPPLIQQANAKHIPVIIDDVGGGGTDYDAIIVSDNARAGEMAAEYMDQQVKQKHLASRKVASITCKASSVYAQRRNAGFVARMQALGYTVVATRNGNSSATTSYAATRAILTSFPDIAGIFVCNGPMSIAAAQALTDTGKSGSQDIILVGFDAGPQMFAAMKAGTISGTFIQEDYTMGTMAVDLVTRALNGQPFSYNNEQDREIYVPVQLITAANVPQS